MLPRYTPGRYRDCRFCGGRGCCACDGEAEKDYKQAFPDGPQPIATFRTDDPAAEGNLAQLLTDLGIVPTADDSAPLAKMLMGLTGGAQ